MEPSSPQVQSSGERATRREPSQPSRRASRRSRSEDLQAADERKLPQRQQWEDDGRADQAGNFPTQPARRPLQQARRPAGLLTRGTFLNVSTGRAASTRTRREPSQPDQCAGRGHAGHEDLRSCGREEPSSASAARGTASAWIRQEPSYPDRCAGRHAEAPARREASGSAPKH